MRRASHLPAIAISVVKRLRSVGLGVVLASFSATLSAGGQSLADAMRSGHEHDSAEWADIARHLPDPATTSAERLELTADVLRARRFYPDALTFYNAALDHGADGHVILKKMGIACLEIQQPVLAKMLFARAAKLDKRDAIAWNDMAAADLALGDPRSAVSEYRHAIKLDRANAVFHANLALAYFEVHSPQEARRELDKALRLNPEVLHGTAHGGFSAQVLSSEHYGDMCLQMAHLYARKGDEATLLEWLGKASERGLNLRAAMQGDPVLLPWLNDARVLVFLRNHERLNASAKAPAPAGVPSLGTASAPPEAPVTAALRRDP